MMRMLGRVLLFTACFCLPIVAPASGFWFGAPDWPTLKRTIRERFPEVRQLSTEELRVLLRSAQSPLLIDARAIAEVQVSHLLGARHAENSAEAAQLLAGLPENRAVVVYCSVGHRSSALARELMKLGYTNVANLEGSIFEWANKGWPVYRDGKPVDVVHPYDASWGRLLEKKYWPAEWR